MDVWFISDQHYSHSNILNFTNRDGLLLRPGFEDVEEMDEVMIERHNEVITPQDKIYFLGDVCFRLNRFHSIMPRLNGKKRLILGNHDKFNMGDYQKYFQKIMESWRPQRNMLFTHRPTYLNTEKSDGELLVNVHGHIHRGQIDNPIYLNVSVEETGYYPIHFSTIVEKFKQRGINL